MFLMFMNAATAYKHWCPFLDMREPNYIKHNNISQASPRYK